MRTRNPFHSHPRRPAIRWYRPQVELLENRLVLFKSWLTLEPNHENITVVALPFLRERILDQINEQHIVQELFEAFTSAAHMDNCELWQSAAAVNDYYARAVQAADPANFLPMEVASWFGKLLHGVQDFYAHSNWVDLGMTTLLDVGEGPWDPLKPYSYHDGALLVQGAEQEPFGPGSLQRFDFQTYVIIDEVWYPGVVTGTFGFGQHECPENIAIPHGSPITLMGMNKDGPNEYNGALFPQAAWMGADQTAHEFYRLVRMVETTYGTADHLINAWTAPGPGPQGGARKFLEQHRAQPGLRSEHPSAFPMKIGAYWTIEEMDRRYLPRLAQIAAEMGVPNHPYLAILNSGDMRARLELGEMLHGHSHPDHDHEHDAEHDHEHAGTLPETDSQAGLVVAQSASEPRISDASQKRPDVPTLLRSVANPTPFVPVPTTTTVEAGQATRTPHSVIDLELSWADFVFWAP